ncbi:MAG: ECF transporter S component [Prevotellaceae bacterium]|jgi:hypothetical protein|nr:ECF transporter S component [Prevotellaceae bacterium]
MATTFFVRNINFSAARAYLLSGAFILGNLLLPQLCHLTPYGGNILLPIYFFTLIAAYKFGWQVGIATAILSPLMNSALFGMPPVAVLPFILIKSALLATVAAVVAGKTQKLSILHLLVVVLVYQIVGSSIESLILGDFAAGMVDFKLAFSGMLIQVVGGYLLLKALAKK